VLVLGSTLRSGADAESVIESVGEERRGWLEEGRSRRRTEDSKAEEWLLRC